MTFQRFNPDDNRPPDMKPGMPVSNEAALHAAAATCVVCHSPAEADDVALQHGDGRGVCIRCYHRHTDSTKPMPKELRRELQSILASVEG